MTSIYLLVVQEPPSEQNGCFDCQFMNSYQCSAIPDWRSISYAKEIPDWCPLVKVPIKGAEHE